MAVNRYIPPATPGWDVHRPPARSPLRVVAPILAREGAIFGALILAALITGILASPSGWLAVGIARCLLKFLSLHIAGHQFGGGFRRLAATLTEWAAVGVLGAIIAAAHTPTPDLQIPELKAPIQIEASQIDVVAQVRRIVAEAWERAKEFPHEDKPTAKDKEANR